MAKLLGEMLIDAGLINKDQLNKALEASKNSDGRLGFWLVKNNDIEEKDLLKFLSKQYGVPSINLDEYEIDQSIIQLVPSEIALKYQVLPISKSGRILTVAIADPHDILALDDLRFRTGYEIEAVVSSESMIRRKIDKYYEAADTYAKIMQDMELEEEIDLVQSEDEEEKDVLESEAEQAPVIRVVNSLLVDAVKQKASDIHVECFEKSVRVRYRIDGTLIEQPPPPFSMKNAIISRLKIMAELDIAERRVPQDGRIRIKMKGRNIDFRVSTMPTIFGEKIVLRILDKSNLQLDLPSLGFEKRALKNFLKAIEAPWGMVLVTGPTGSGKTTTLYSAIGRINTPEVNISTAEDPVEYNLYGINQVHVKEEVGMTFPAALKAFLRQDPDIVLVGEIRDLDTGAVAIKAALTGHLVLSTLHTNDAPSTINRMIDMGIDPFLVANSTILIQAQRLVKRVCKYCKREVKIHEETFRELGLDPKKMKGRKFYEGAGCDRCHGTGYKGRQGIFEVMPISGKIQELILDGATTPEIRKQAVKEGMLTLRMDAIIKWMRGITDVKQIFKETSSV